MTDETQMRWTLLLVIACLAATESEAMAKPLRLSGTKLTYFNRSTYKTEVQEAVRMWNASGTPVQLRPARSAQKASVTFVTKPSLTHKGQRVAGLGGIHFTKKRKPFGLVQLSSSALGTPGQTDTGDVDVVAHELGHALGLPHSTQQCTLMYPVGEFVRSLCPPSSSDTYRCGPQRADAAALAKLYRGNLRWPASAGLCSFPTTYAEFLEPPEGAVSENGFVRFAVRNGSPRTWTDTSVALTSVDADGQRTASPCGATMELSPMESAIAPGEVAHFEAFACGPATGATVRVRAVDTDTETVFGPVRSYVG